MITDKVIQVFYGITSFLVNALPDVGSAPAWIGSASGVIGAADMFIPVSGLATLFGWMAGVFGALYIWRAVRFFNPLGG